MICNLCPRQCNCERTEAKNVGGYCKMPLAPKIARAALHFWEEPCISGTSGSGTVFFSGCSLGCVFCQNYDISAGGYGKTVSVERLSDIFKELEKSGASNINLVCPTHYALAIKQALDIYRPHLPIVYNSGGYDSVKALKLLEGYIDIFLMDFKFLSPDRAELYSDAADYPLVAKDALAEAYRQQGECVLENGIMKRGVIVRHLLLPQATNEAIRIFDWVREHLPGAYFSIMSQYLPCGKAAEYPAINRRVTKREYEKVISYISDTGFENCFIQERSSSSDHYIPPFDLYGV